MLFRLEHRMGFGDAVALTAALRHLRHYEPGCRIELVVNEGRERLYAGLADQVTSARDLRRPPTHRVQWPLPMKSYRDWPSTYVEKCLLEQFGLEPITELCGYQVAVDPDDRRVMRGYLDRLAAAAPVSPRRRFAICHFQGVALPERKNLNDDQAAAVVVALQARGYRVLIWDENARSCLPDEGLGERINAGAVHRIRPNGSSSLCAGRLAGLLAEVDLFVGVDSGPLHLASAIGTPAVGLWTRQSPLHCICPDETTVHVCLIPPYTRNPREYERFYTWRPIQEGLSFFKAHYRHLWCDDFGAGVVEALSRLFSKAAASRR